MRTTVEQRREQPMQHSGDLRQTMTTIAVFQRHLEMQRTANPPPDWRVIRAKMLAMKDAGKSYLEIGAEFGLSWHALKYHFPKARQEAGRPVRTYSKGEKLSPEALDRRIRELLAEGLPTVTVAAKLRTSRDLVAEIDAARRVERAQRLAALSAKPMRGVQVPRAPLTGRIAARCNHPGCRTPFFRDAAGIGRMLCDRHEREREAAQLRAAESRLYARESRRGA